jgi:hypothetical protein
MIILNTEGQKGIASELAAEELRQEEATHLYSPKKFTLPISSEYTLEFAFGWTQ